MAVVIFCIYIFIIAIPIMFYFFQTVVRNILVRAQLTKIIEHEGYAERFNDIDRHARNGVSVAEYIASVRYPNIQESVILLSLIRNKDMEPFWLTSIPWRFLIFSKGEGGLPHTHGPFIMLPYAMLNEGLIKPSTLIHEKIHVFQRLYPIETNQYIVKSYPITGFAYPKDNMRSNPDTSRILFGDIRTVWADYTNTSSMISMTDIVDHRDHPFEIMAYKFQ